MSIIKVNSTAWFMALAEALHGHSILTITHRTRTMEIQPEIFGKSVYVLTVEDPVEWALAWSILDKRMFSQEMRDQC
jgi:hypothetical protein